MKTIRKRAFTITAAGMLGLAGHSMAATGGPDAFGYTWSDSLSFEWLDISSSGTAVVTSGDDSSSTSATDGIGTAVKLGFPFTFYGQTHTELVPTTNGYLSADPAERGFDNSSDCPLPASPSHGGGARIYAFHRDLNFDFADANVYYQYFDESPHFHNKCGVSVFTWENARVGSSPTVKIRFQALLYDTGDVVINYDTGGFSIGSPFTIGIQSDGSRPDGLSALCDPASAVSGQASFLFEPPTVVVLGSTENALQDAIDAVPAGGKVTFQFTGSSTVHHYDHTFQIDKPMSINGPKGPGSSTTYIPFDAKGIQFAVKSKLVVTRALIRSASSDAFQMGNNETLKLSLCSVFGSGDSAVDAGDDCRVDIVRSSIEASAPDSASLIQMGDHPHLRIIDSVIADSRVDAIALDHFGLPPSEPNVFVQRSSIVNNMGAAISAGSVFLHVENSTLSNNHGAGISAAGCEVRCVHNTIVENFVGLYLNDSDAEIGHTILADNRDPGENDFDLQLAAGATAVSLGRNFVKAGAGVFSVVSNDLIGTDPMLTPLGMYGKFVGPRKYSAGFSHLPLAGSPVINAGGFSATGTSSLDQRGFPRYADGNNTGSVSLDIGSVEMGSFVLVDTHIDEDNGAVGFGISLREAGGLAPENGAIRFDASLDGMVIDINNFGGSQKTIPAVAFVDASDLPSGITITGDSIGNAHLFGGRAAHGLTFEGGESRAFRDDSGSVVSFSHCTFLNNRPSFGNGAPAYDVHGGAILSAGILHVSHCRFLGNEAQAATAGSGGAIASVRIVSQNGGTGQGVLHVVESSFESNRGFVNGGAIYSAPGAARCRIDRCSFVENQSSSAGAVSAGPSPLSSVSGVEISNSTFQRNDVINHTGVGGGLMISGSGWRNGIRYCTFHENTASTGGADGGAIYVSGGEVIMDHCVVTNNLAEEGGGITLNNDAALRIRNSVLDNNYGTYNGLLTVENLRRFGSASVVSGGWNLTQDYIPEFDHPNDILGVDPQLGQLQFNGGPTMTRYPLATSPAIDGGSGGAMTDQRGLSGRFGSQSDIGSVEIGEAMVVRTHVDKLDVSVGFDRSLREAIRDVPDGGRIVFDPQFVTGDEIQLTTALSQLTISKNVTIDATSLPKGITIRGAGNARCLNVTVGDYNVALHGVSFRGGNAALRGGAIRKGANATLSISQSAIYGNHANGDGGAIRVESGRLLLRNVTISGNTTDATGGAISAIGGADLDIAHCTIVDNVAVSGAAGIDLDSTAQLTINYTVLGQNLLTSTALSNYEADASAVTTSLGKNFTDDLGHSWFVGTDRTANLLISSLGDLGGLAKVHPPQPLSPIVNMGYPNQIVDVRSDARGLPRVYGGSLDCGAMEMGGNGVDTDNDGIPDEWEIFYGMNKSDPNDAGLDVDGDGRTALEEHLAHTIPNMAGSVLKARSFAISSIPSTGGITSIDLDWNSVPGLVYEIWHSTDLGVSDPWEKVATVPSKFDGEITDAVLDDASILNELTGYFQIRPADS